MPNFEGYSAASADEIRRRDARNARDAQAMREADSYRDAQAAKAAEKKPEERRPLTEIMEELTFPPEKNVPLNPEDFLQKPPAPPSDEEFKTVIEAAYEELRSVDVTQPGGYRRAALGVLNYIGLRGLPAGVEQKQFDKQNLASTMAQDKRMHPVLERIVNNAKNKFPSADDLATVSTFVQDALRT